MSIHTGRIPLLLIVVAIFAALIVGCQSQPAATAAPAQANPTSASPANANPASAYPGGLQQPASAVQAYPGAAVAGQVPASKPAAGAYPAAAGAPAAPNQASVVAQLLEQRAGANADQVILHVKLISAAPTTGTDFISQLVNKEMDLVASSANLPTLAANDQFEALVSLIGDEKSQQYSANQIKKK